MKAPLSTLQPSRRINMNRRQASKEKSDIEHLIGKRGQYSRKNRRGKNVQSWVTYKKKEEAKRERN